MKPTHTLLGGLIFCGLLSINANAYELTLNIDGISKPTGAMMIAIANSDQSFSGKTANFKEFKIPVTQASMKINLGDLPAGDYAVKLYQDENDNGQMDSNMLGIPSEGYGFSNNGGAMGQPDFKDAKFSISQDTVISIHLR